MQQMQQAEQENQRAELEAKREIEMEKIRIVEDNNIRDNDTKLMIAGMKEESNEFKEFNEINEVPFDSQKREELAENVRQFNEKQSLERDKFNFEKEKVKEDQRLKEKQIRKKGD